MTIKIFYKSNVFGPISSPSSVLLICNALRVTFRAKPSLKNNLQESENSYSFQDANVPVTDGVYELLCQNDLEWDDSLDAAQLQQAKHHARSTPPTRSRAVKEETDTDEELRAIARHLRRREWEKQQTMEVDDDNTNADMFHHGYHAGDFESGVEAMLHVIASIPQRYFKYNQVLSVKMGKALSEVSVLQKTLESLKGQSDPEPAERLKDENSIAKPSSVCLTKSIPIDTVRSFIAYRIISTLTDVWAAVWCRFGPRFRRYHISDLTTISSLERAEHCINRFHVWRRTIDATTWTQMQNSTTLGHLVHVSRLWRKGKYTPRVVHIDMTNSNTASEEPYQYLIKPTFVVDPNAWDSPPLPKVNRKAALQSVRKLLIDAMMRTGAYKDADLAEILCGLVDLDRTAEQAAANTEAIAYPSEYVTRALRREFGICV